MSTFVIYDFVLQVESYAVQRIAKQVYLAIISYSVVIVQDMYSCDATLLIATLSW